MYKRNVIRWIMAALVVSLSACLLSGCFDQKEGSKDSTELKNKQNTIDNSQNQNIPQENSADEGEQGNGNPDENAGVFPGDKAYDFSLLDREGNEIKLSDLRGKVVFIYFWRTEDINSTRELPAIQEVYEKYEGKDVVILAVNVLTEKSGMDAVNQYMEEKGYTFPVLYDVDGAMFTQYKIRVFPTTYIIDKNGIIADVVTVLMDKATILHKIEEVLNQ